MRVFAAWLNHDDARSINSIDTYVNEGGRQYIRHYMQDFGSNLGSGSRSAQQPRGGYEYLLDRGKVGKGIAGFGFYRRPWMNVKWPKDSSIGNIEADVFNPATWKTEYPNPSFNQLDAADAFWAASIMAKFSDEMIRRIVADAQLSDKAASSYLADVIIARRDKTVQWAITRTNPVDRFQIRGTTPELAFDNAAVRLGLAQGVRYTVRWAPWDNAAGTVQATHSEVETTVTRVAIPSGIWGPEDKFGLGYAVASIATFDPQYQHWASPVLVTVRNRGGALEVVGIDRPTDIPAVANRGR
jgi:hypothetical protein